MTLDQIKQKAAELYPLILIPLTSDSIEYNVKQRLQRAAYITGATEDRWVSGKELPEKTGMYLTYYEGWQRIMKYSAEHKMWENDETPQYWQPLPAPPTINDNKKEI